MFKTTRIIIAMICVTAVLAFAMTAVIASWIASDRTIGMLLFFCLPIAMVVASFGEIIVNALWRWIAPHDYNLSLLLKSIGFAFYSRFFVIQSRLKLFMQSRGWISEKPSLYQRYVARNS